jgi:uncharacterized protein (UPF0254 family)
MWDALMGAGDNSSEGIHVDTTSEPLSVSMMGTAGVSPIGVGSDTGIGTTAGVGVSATGTGIGVGSGIFTSTLWKSSKTDDQSNHQNILKRRIGITKR